ncbi:hypothetical protein Rxycam_01922 [Rubrobacter xylanophilus DSM 9941]|uniref:sulfotransferase n=1 Tax=Rubrobacter xylanophilus TaxID=49319 RepID=UPI001C643C2B|nr:sulfotransferase [Rubrobacter xylanophilus]QYJ16091.1 hypothetical protein Rxycam_01922 [Rubrobacter xylanophilus DSM 9941]
MKLSYLKEKLPIGKAADGARYLLGRDGLLTSRLFEGRRLRRQLALKNREIAALKEELARRSRGPAATRMPPVSPDVFFVVGHQKSGTTWLMKMLDAHPEILCRGEGRPFGRNFRQKHKAGRGGYPPVSLYNAIADSRGLRLWIQRSVWTKRDRLDEHLNNLTRLAIEYFLTQELVESGKRMVGDKTVLLTPDIVEEIAAVYPEAKVIHIIRDGRDVAVSTMHHIWNQAEDRGGHSRITPAQREKREAYWKDPEGLIKHGGGIFPDGWLRNYAAQWKRRVGKTVEDGPTLLGQNYAEVRYEDLLARPHEELARLLHFLGADAGEEKVRGCVEAASFERLSRGRRRGEEAPDFFRKGIAGDWKNVFTEHNRREFKEAAGDLLIRLGYERDESW